MQDFAKSFYDGAAWRKCRASFIAARRAADGGLCQRCCDRLGLIVHHKIELTPLNITDPTVALNHDNLEYLCLDCHNREPGHFYDRKGIRPREFSFDSNGDLVARPPRSRKR